MLIQTDEIKNKSINLRRESHFWQAQHNRAAKRASSFKEKIIELEKSLNTQIDLTDNLTKENEKLNSRISWLEQQLFGRKSETTRNNPSQSTGNSRNLGPGIESTQENRRKRGKQKGSKGFGRKRRDELATDEIIVDFPSDSLKCPHCGKLFCLFPGTEDSETIDWEVTLIRRIYRRMRYQSTCNCQNLPGIFSPPPPPKLILKGMFSNGFWTRLLIEKFLFQRPLHRICQSLSLEGFNVSPGTLTGSLQRIKKLIQPLYALILERNRQARHWKMDETRWMIYEETEGKKGYKHWLWVSITFDTCIYLIEPTRSAEVPKNHLGNNAEGIINADRYSAYKALGDTIHVAFCWSHIRRDFVRIGNGYKTLRKWAANWVAEINTLFSLNAKRLSFSSDSEEFLQADELVRKQVCKINETKNKDLTKKQLHKVQRKALESLDNHWQGATIFVNLPEIPMDNNESERCLRNPVIGRKNYYGSRALWSGNFTAMMFTVFQTLLKNQIDPQKFLLAYFDQCALCKGNAPDDLTPLLPWELSREQKSQWCYPSKVP